MKQAYLILAHNEWDTLNLLLQMLDFEFNDVFLHIDKRVAVLPRLYEFKAGRLFVIAGRKTVAWGDFSIVETEYLLYHEAIKHGPYMMYHMLSGVDMPLKPQNDIYRFFQRHKDKNFVGIRRSSLDLQDLQERWSYHYLFMSCNKRNTSDLRPRPVRLLMTVLRHLVVNIEQILHIKRNTDIELIKHHQWTSLNQQAVELLIDKENEVRRRFSRTLCPDEAFIATMLCNSPLRNTLYDIEDDRLGAMRNIDWMRGAPYVWQPDDMVSLKLSPYMFARKISPKLAKMLSQR